MFLNDNIVGIEKPDGICSLTFIVDEIYFFTSINLLLNIQDLYK